MLYVYVIFFLLFIIFTRRKSKKNIFILTLIMYLLATISGVYIQDVMYRDVNILLEAVLFHLLMLFILLYPLQKYDKFRYNDFVAINEPKIFSIFIIIISLISIFINFKYIDINLLLTDSTDLRYSLIDGEWLYEKNVFIRYLGFFAEKYWSIALCLFFYYLRFFPSKRLFLLLLFIASLSCIVAGMKVAAREYVLKYLYLFFILTYWFWPYITNKWKRFIKIFLILLSAIFIVLFLIITMVRFGSDSNYDYSAFDSLLSYYGQGFINFSLFFDTFLHGATGGAVSFPFFVGEKISAYNINDTISADFSLNVFATTIGSWVFDVGIVVTIILTIIHNFIFRRVGNKPLTLFTLIYVIWIYDFVFSCLFFYNETLNTSRIASILLIVLIEKFSINQYKKVN